jgi:ABC-type Fe3+/spermidine/putrescine transport system ATPase subunit
MERPPERQNIGQTMWFRAEKIEKTYGKTAILKDISFGMAAGQTLAILGKSGCGKTTLLKIIAGLIPASGHVYVGEEDISEKIPQQRGIVYLYQEALLFPHLNVFENVAFGLRLQGVANAVVQAQVTALLHELGLDEHAQKMPQQLSGGQKQRVAFGRALIIKPRLLLLDEPFGALDSDTRGSMQQFFRQSVRQQGISSIFVTHDLKEALLLGDCWGYMDQGKLEIFNTVEKFSQDTRTGIRHEIDFWKNL